MLEWIISKIPRRLKEPAKFIINRLPSHPLLYIGGFFIVLITLIVLMIFTTAGGDGGGGTSARQAFAFMVFLVISVVTRAPDKFRPALSFKMAMGLTVLISTTLGMGYGLLFSLISVLIEARVISEFPQQTPVTLFARSFFCAILPHYITFGFDRLAFALLPYVVIMYCFTTPVRLFTGKAPFWYLLQYAAFNLIWHTWFLWIFGAALQNMIV